MIHGTDRKVSIDSLLSPLKHEANMVHFAGKPKLLFVQVTTTITTTTTIKYNNNINTDGSRKWKSGPWRAR